MTPHRTTHRYQLAADSTFPPYVIPRAWPPDPAHLDVDHRWVRSKQRTQVVADVLLRNDTSSSLNGHPGAGTQCSGTYALCRTHTLMQLVDAQGIYAPVDGTQATGYGQSGAMNPF